MSKRNSEGCLTKGSSQNGSEVLSDQNSGDKKTVDKDHEEEPKKQKISFDHGRKPLGKLGEKPGNGPLKKGIQIKLGGIGQKTAQAASSVKSPSLSVAAVFNVDDDEEPEEMPPEARMRMRNIGRETPTSAGPNSFGKTKQGFCDAKKMFEKTMKKAMDSSAATHSPTSTVNTSSSIDYSKNID
ncbi:PEST proteolytic signal-containing nuclear protein [Anabrus simplex]|uniref:PEST proteolytic signal-containing nuclear protein n=1 Tax=Anabrus simplex TaxID=316456 RepID=UPI0034DD2A1E